MFPVKLSRNGIDMAAISIPFDNSYAQLPDRFFAYQNPDPVEHPKLIRLNIPLCKTLALDAALLSTNFGADVFSGNVVPHGAEPIALAYAGHQFGGWAPQLGDGRAVLLGEVVGTDGVRRDIHLKGSGRTPFSRGGDGRAALGPILREYIVSEAMHALGVPTTRALAAVTTGQDVLRNGQIPGAILTRVAQSHVRIGTFEYFAARRDGDALRLLADYIIDRHYPDVSTPE
jgi:serine/tyrosine/threonine adenylyltransferase